MIISCIIFTSLAVIVAKNHHVSPSIKEPLESLNVFRSPTSVEDEMFVVQMKDGTEKAIPKKKLLQHDSMHGVVMKNGELSKVESKTGKEEVVLKENRGAANFVKLGRWAFNVLISEKIVPFNSSLKNLKSLDDGNIVGSTISQNVEITLAFYNISLHKNEIIRFQATVVRDFELYKKPHLALISIQDQKGIAIKIPPRTQYMRWWWRLYYEFMDAYQNGSYTSFLWNWKSIFLITILILFIILIRLYLALTKLSRQEKAKYH